MKSLGCNEPQLQKMKTHPGFIAALDQSGGGTPHALGFYGSKTEARAADDPREADLHH